MDDSPDALLDDLQDYMNGPAEEDEDEAWDSQSTEDEDPNYPAPPPKRQRCTSPPVLPWHNSTGARSAPFLFCMMVGEGFSFSCVQAVCI